MQLKTSLETEKAIKIQQIEQSYDKAIIDLRESISV
jgi:hypothetical protein